MGKQSTPPIAQKVVAPHAPSWVPMPNKQQLANITPSLLPLLQLQRKMGNQAIGQLLQAKLTVNQPGDPYEQEADRAAEQVMQMPSLTRIAIQRKCACGAYLDSDGECTACKTRHLTIQRQVSTDRLPSEEAIQIYSESVNQEASSEIETHLSNSQGSGQPLPEKTLHAMETAFAANFTGVRIHNGRTAAQMNQALNAHAFTYGSDIYFNSGKYNTETTEGKGLLAHELTHVVQQNSFNSWGGNAQSPQMVQRSLQTYITAMNKKPVPDWELAAEHLNGEKPNIIKDRLKVLPPENRVKLHEAARKWPGICSNIARFTEADYLKVTPTATPKSGEVCNKEQADMSDAFSQTPSQLVLALERIRQIAVPFTPQDKAQKIYEALKGIDLNNLENLNSVIVTINATFAAHERGAILTTFLMKVDATAPSQPLPQSAKPSAEDEARMNRQMEMMGIPPRGPYKQYGPGVLAPVLSQPARHLLPLVEGAGNAFAGAGSFVQGLLVGLQSSMSEKDREQLATHLMQSTVLNSVFPFVFAAGAVVGILEDVVEAVKGIYHLITGFSQFIKDMKDLFLTFISPDSKTIGRVMGEQVGRDYGKRIVTLARGNIFEFTFSLGRLIGPTIVYTVLAFLGVPELVASAIISRLMTILRPLLQKFPRLLALAERIALRLARKQIAHTSATELEADLERSFQHTFTEPAPHVQPGSPTLQAPEVSAGFGANRLSAFRRLLGRALTEADVNDLARVWSSVANPGEAATLTLQNSRQLFDNHRNRFWRAVRNDTAARKLFEDAGCVFEGGTSTAPFYRLPDGSQFQMTIDHMIERQTNPGRALDPANLRIVSRRENTVLLRQLHDQDPFLQ